VYRTALRRMRLRGVKREALGRVSDGDQRVERGWHTFLGWLVEPCVARRAPSLRCL